MSSRLVHIVDDVPELEGLDGLTMVAVLDGFLDAGSAGAGGNPNGMRLEKSAIPRLRSWPMLVASTVTLVPRLSPLLHCCTRSCP